MAWNILPNDVTALTVTEAVMELDIAVHERFEGGFPVDSISAELTQMDVIRPEKLIEIENNIDAMLGVTIPLTSRGGINQFNNGGVWNGLSTFPPYWTEADILTHIGDPSRIRLDPSFTNLYEIPADWVKQSMQIINLMQIAGNRGTISKTLPQKTARKTATNTTQASVISDYASAPTTLNGFIVSVGQFSYFKSPDYKLESDEYRNFVYGTTSQRDKIDDLELYMFMEAPSQATTNNYDAMGNPWTVEDAYNIVRIDSSPVVLTEINIVFDDLSQPDIETVNNTARGWQCVAVGNNGVQGHLVYRYTFDKQV